MVEDGGQQKRHFVLGDTASPEPFQPKGGGPPPKLHLRDRRQHGNGLLRQLGSLKPEFEQAKSEQISAGLEEGFGLQIEFESFPDIELAFESLAVESSGIELLNIRHDGDKTLASVFVPDGKLSILSPSHSMRSPCLRGIEGQNNPVRGAFLPPLPEIDAL